MAAKKRATSPPWLQELEQRVREASDEIRRLRGENRQLAARADALTESLEEARSADREEGSWEDERQEIRARVERLSQRLEGLLDGDEDGSD